MRSARWKRSCAWKVSYSSLTSAAEGGATCKVRFAPGLVVKECPTGDVRTEYELTQRAEAVLGDARVVEAPPGEDIRDVRVHLGVDLVALGAGSRAGGRQPPDARVVRAHLAALEDLAGPEK